jgi:hypothetical protein
MKTDSCNGKLNRHSIGAASSDVCLVGNFTSGPASNEEVTAFTSRRPVELVENVGWTSASNDVANVTFSPEISVPFTVWIVRGSFATQRDLAIDHCVTTSSIWRDERMGVRFSQFFIVDATNDPDAPTYFDFDCSMRAGIQNMIGRRANRINVYWVNTVDGGTGRGQACAFGSDFVAMGRTAIDELLVHEFGHNFDLRHVDGQATFDNSNIMDSSSTRAFITEGQQTRAHLNGNSALNGIYGARTGEPIRTCSHGANNNHCTVLNTRIWADGAFPANLGLINELPNGSTCFVSPAVLTARSPGGAGIESFYRPAGRGPC